MVESRTVSTTTDQGARIMKKIIGISLIVVILLSLFGCAAQPVRSGNDYDESISQPGAPTVFPVPQPTEKTPQTGLDSIENDLSDRMIVRNGDMTIMVEEIKPAIDYITQLANSVQGWVVSSQIYPENAGGTAGYVTVRVPAGKFEETMKAIENFAVEVKSQSTSSRDVTQEYTDLNSKLTNLQATEQQYLKILEQARTVEEILQVQSYLSRTRQDIEVITGQIQYLERTASTSLITVQMQQSKLIATINVSRTVANIDQVISFSAGISGGFSPYSYEWDFGDRVNSTRINPEHSYRSTGTFKVVLKITDDRGNTTTDERYITIAGGWDGGSVARSAWRALLTVGRSLLNIVIWLGIFSFIWVPAGIIVWFVARRKKKTGDNKPV